MIRVVLAGAGHAHLHVVSQAARFRKLGIELTLIDPGTFWYSGLATGMLGGMYEPATDQLDAQALTESCGGRFIQDKVASVDRNARRVRLQSGDEVDYDLLSFNVGSRVNTDLERSDRVWPVKPIADLCRLRGQIEQWNVDQPCRLVVVGGGPTGSEIAANLDSLCRRNEVTPEITLVNSRDRLLHGYPERAGARLHRALEERGLTLRLGERVTDHDNGVARTRSGEAIPFDHMVVATGLQAAPLVTELGLPCDTDRGLRVSHCLQSTGDDRIFAAGDCADIEGEQLPRLGVFGVRAAPVLADNLIRAAGHQALRRYDPQERYLAILNLGDGHGLALWDRFWWYGRAAMTLKNRIDCRFMDGYRSCYA